MPVLTTASATPFTPTKDVFLVEVSGGAARLLARTDATDTTWSLAGTLEFGEFRVVDGEDFLFEAVDLGDGFLLHDIAHPGG